MVNKTTKNWITEGIVIALIPFLGYLFTFAFESGYATFFNFPKEFINIGLPQVVITISILYTTAVLLFFGIEFLSFVFFKNEPSLYHNIVSFLPLFGYSIGYFIISGWSAAIPFIILIFILGFSSFIAPLITESDKKDYESKLQAFDKSDWEFREDRGVLSVRLIRMIGHRNIMLIINLFICFGLTQTLGGVLASRQIRFFVIPSKPEKVILKIYGENLICAEFNRKTKNLKSEISIYKSVDPQVQNLKFEILGPLKVQKLTTQKGN